MENGNYCLGLRVQGSLKGPPEPLQPIYICLLQGPLDFSNPHIPAPIWMVLDVRTACFNLLMKTRCFVGCGFRNVSRGVACVSLVWQIVFHQYLLWLDMGLPKNHLLYSPFKNFKKYNHQDGNSQKVARLFCGNSRMPKFKVPRL